MLFHLIFYLDSPYNKIYEDACLPFSAPYTTSVSSSRKTETIFFCDRDSSIKKCMQFGCPVIAVSHTNNRSESLMGTPWLILSPDALTEDFLKEVCCRHHGLPLTVADTARCHIREFTMEDLPALLALQKENVHNPDGCFFPSDCNNPKEYLHNYIQHQYPFYGYGLYAVLQKISGEFMGIIGFTSVSFPLKADGNCGLNSSLSKKSNNNKSGPFSSKAEEYCAPPKENDDGVSPGKSTAEVSYGFLQKWQHQGFAEESLTGLLKYGREKNGYGHFCARIHPSNTASLTLARRCNITIIIHT